MSHSYYYTSSNIRLIPRHVCKLRMAFIDRSIDKPDMSLTASLQGASISEKLILLSSVRTLFSFLTCNFNSRCIPSRSLNILAIFVFCSYRTTWRMQLLRIVAVQHELILYKLPILKMAKSSPSRNFSEYWEQKCRFVTCRDASWSCPLTAACLYCNLSRNNHKRWRPARLRSNNKEVPNTSLTCRKKAYSMS